MKRPLGMNQIMRGLLLVAPALFLLACGGDQSMASKSAAAYREAQAKGVPVGGGHEHGGHEAATATGGTVEMHHPTHGTGVDAHAGHAGGDAAVDHHAHGAAAAVDHAAMGHGTAGHAQHGAASHASGGHQGHESGPGTQMDHAQHAAPGAAADPHAGHAMTGAAPAPIAASAPRSSSEMRSVQPSSTLQPDVFDAPAASSVAEAAKATQGGGHEGHPMRGITPGADRENPPTPMPATRDRKKN